MFSVVVVVVGFIMWKRFCNTAKARQQQREEEEEAEEDKTWKPAESENGNPPSTTS